MQKKRVIKGRGVFQGKDLGLLFMGGEKNKIDKGKFRIKGVWIFFLVCVNSVTRYR